MIFALVPIMSCAMIRNLKFIAPLSTAANISMAIGLGIILSYCVVDLPTLNSRTAVAHWSQIPLFFGTAIYAFEGISLVSVLRLNNTIHQVDSATRCPDLIIFWSYSTSVILLYIYRYCPCNWKWKHPIDLRQLWECWTSAWLSWPLSFWPWALWDFGGSATTSKEVWRSTFHPLSCKNKNNTYPHGYTL